MNKGFKTCLTNQMTECTSLIKDPLFKVSFGKETIKEV